jgi:hypothetical protein
MEALMDDLTALTVIAACAVVLACKALFDVGVTIRDLRRTARFDAQRAEARATERERWTEMKKAREDYMRSESTRSAAS